MREADTYRVVQLLRGWLSALNKLHNRDIMLADLRAEKCEFAPARSSERTRYMAPQTVSAEVSSTTKDDMFAVMVWVLVMFNVQSGIPDKLTKEDCKCDINMRLYLWYAELRPVEARAREAELQTDIEDTLRKWVSPRWFPAISKVVVGGLRYSRDARLTPDEAAAILLPCREASAEPVGLPLAECPATFTPVPLADGYTCPVCMEDLYPAVAYQCLHKVCEACAPRCADCPKCKATGPPPRRDHDFGNLVEQQRSIFGFVCDTCFTSVSPEERSWHTCADALADRVFAMAASAGVARADLRVDVQTVIRAKQARQEVSRLEMDGMLTDLFRGRADRANAEAAARDAEAAAAARDAAAAAAADRAVLRAEVEAARQEAADAKAEADARQEAANAKAEGSGRAAPSNALVLIDFDQDGTKDATQVLDLLTNMMDKLVRGMFDENNCRTQFQWCNRRDCQEGLECTFAHRKTEAAQASELTFKIQGKQVPASELVKNRTYLVMTNNADHKIVRCRHRAACEDRLECTFAHCKPEAMATGARKLAFEIQEQ